MKKFVIGFFFFLLSNQIVVSAIPPASANWETYFQKRYVQFVWGSGSAKKALLIDLKQVVRIHYQASTDTHKILYKNGHDDEAPVNSIMSTSPNTTHVEGAWTAYYEWVKANPIFLSVP